MPNLPDPVIEERDGLLVLRDDLLPGGTKRRAIGVLLHGASEFVYASPAQGYAQVALAYGCADLGLKATVFVARRKSMHPSTREAKRAGAAIHEEAPGYLSVVDARARRYCAATGARLLPHGFDTPLFVQSLAYIASSLPIRPCEVWLVAGSGVMCRAIEYAWPNAEVHAVQIGHKPTVGRATIHRAPETFEQDARMPPPFPSCANYDAKAWRFIRQHAKPGALFWNVAG